MVRNFPPDKNDDAGGLSPGEKEDAYWRKKTRHNIVIFIRVSYYSGYQMREKSRPQRVGSGLVIGV